MNYSQQVREHALRYYVLPARRQKRTTLQIPVRAIQQALRFSARRTSLVCAALQSRKFLQAAGLAMEKIEGPASAMSSTVVCHYRLVNSGSPAAVSPQQQFLRARGMASALFRSVGGGERFLAGERRAFHPRSGKI